MSKDNLSIVLCAISMLSITIAAQWFGMDGFILSIAAWFIFYQWNGASYLVRE